MCMKRTIVVAIVLSLVGGKYVYSQVDVALNTIDISDFSHIANADVEEEQEIKFTKGEDSKVLVLKQLFLKKENGEWMYDADSCGLKRLKAIQMAYLKEGTKAIYCGLSFSQGEKKRKVFRSVSYPVLSELGVGDTLKIDLQLLADKDHQFRPYYYTSEKMKVKQGKLKNGSYLEFHGKVPKGSKNDQDLVTTSIRIPITEENKEIGWVHIINDEDSLHRGFIIQSDFTMGDENNEEFQKIYYANDSYKIDTKNKEVLEKIANNLQEDQYISLRGYADPSGDKSYNIQLARKRAIAVQEFFIEKGVDPSRITIEEFEILHNRNARENRICTILVL